MCRHWLFAAVVVDVDVDVAVVVFAVVAAGAVV